jgi:uncharacterized protein
VESLELVLLAAWSFTVAVAGGLAGLVLGNLRLPVVVALASSPAAGAGANVATSGIAALASSVAHARAGRIDWRVLGWLAAPSLAGGVAGGLLAGVVPGRLLLVGIAVVILYSAYDIARRSAREEPRRRPSGNRRIAEVLGVGFVVGVLGGLVGLILGSLRLPALLGWVESAKVAVGTNSAAGAVVGLGGLIGHLPSGIDWAIVAVAGAASVPGALIGARMVGRLAERDLLRAIAAILVVAGAAMLVAAAAGD